MKRLIALLALVLAVAGCSSSGGHQAAATLHVTQTGATGTTTLRECNSPTDDGVCVWNAAGHHQSGSDFVNVFTVGLDGRPDGTVTAFYVTEKGSQIVLRDDSGQAVPVDAGPDDEYTFDGHRLHIVSTSLLFYTISLSS